MDQRDRERMAANREAWNASAPHHLESARYRRLLQDFAIPGFSCLGFMADGSRLEPDLLTERLQALDINGKDVAHLCCNNGCETLSVKNLGAASAVGFDQSGAFLRHAEAFRAAGHIDCRFVETNVYDIDASFDAGFDIVLVTIGVLGWMPDLPGFIAVADRLLRPGGAFLVYEQHPIMNMTEPFEPEPDPARLTHSYFKSEPFEEQGPITYDGTSAPGDQKHYWFVHTLSDVFSACLAQNFAIEHFKEYPHNISSADFDIFNDQTAQLPQCYMLVARKGG